MIIHKPRTAPVLCLACCWITSSFAKTPLFCELALQYGPICLSSKHRETTSSAVFVIIIIFFRSFTKVSSLFQSAGALCFWINTKIRAE